MEKRETGAAGAKPANLGRSFREVREDVDWLIDYYRKLGELLVEGYRTNQPALVERAEQLLDEMESRNRDGS